MLGPVEGLRAVTRLRHRSKATTIYAREMYYVYILRCVDDSFYIGHTDDLTDRITRHNEGRGAPRSNASGNSSRWTRRKKEALTRGDMTALKRL